MYSGQPTPLSLAIASSKERVELLTIISDANLLAHGLRVGYCGAEEAIPLQSAIEPGPVVVAVARVRQTPGDQGVELSVGWVTWLS